MFQPDSAMQRDEEPEDETFATESRARLSASLRMVGLALGVVTGMVVGVALDSIVLGAALGIGVGIAAAAVLERVTRPRTP